MSDPLGHSNGNLGWKEAGLPAKLPEVQDNTQGPTRIPLASLAGACHRGHRVTEVLYDMGKAAESRHAVGRECADAVPPRPCAPRAGCGGAAGGQMRRRLGTVSPQGG